jgi:hypothetical protein
MTDYEKKQIEILNQIAKVIIDKLTMIFFGLILIFCSLLYIGVVLLLTLSSLS